MAKSKPEVKYRYRNRARKESHRRKKPEIHLVPAVLETVGVLYPGLNSGDQQNGGWPGVFSSSNPTLDSKAGAFMGGLQGYGNFGNDIDAALLIAGGMIARWIGKKTGLGRIGTRGVKIL